MHELKPLSIRATLAERGLVRFEALIEGNVITVERYAPGDGDKRRKIANRWSQDHRLRNGTPITSDTICCELERVELSVLDVIEDIISTSTETKCPLEVACYQDKSKIVELAWNLQLGSPDFIVFDRISHHLSRSIEVETASSTLIVPAMCKGIVTPGEDIEGAVSVPTECDLAGNDSSILRQDLREFINTYVELPGDACSIAVEYILLSWVYDNFDEVPYLAFRTAEAGRGKSRALETVGILCYRPLFVGGGSSPAATLRMLDIFQGTLIADEFDQNVKTEIGAELNRILNQGFQNHRPLIKCDGEQNSPKAFRCFGPKIFALRNRLGDDATESRTISIHMKQRTRMNIPLNLPRSVFERQALELRNRLLAYRFANCRKITIDPTMADPRLEDRMNQIGLPLLAVAQCKGTRDIIVSALHEQQGSIAAARSESLAGDVFNAIQMLYQPGELVRAGAVAKEVNRVRAKSEGLDLDKLKSRVTSKRVGRILSHELALQRLDRDAKGIPYLISQERFDQLLRRYDPMVGECTQHANVQNSEAAVEKY